MPPAVADGARGRLYTPPGAICADESAAAPRSCCRRLDLQTRLCNERSCRPCSLIRLCPWRLVSDWDGRSFQEGCWRPGWPPRSCPTSTSWPFRSAFSTDRPSAIGDSPTRSCSRWRRLWWHLGGRLLGQLRAARMTSEQREDLLDQPLVFLHGAPVDVEDGEIVEVGSGQRSVGTVSTEIDGLEAGAGGLRVVRNENDVEVRPLLGDVEKELSAIAPEEVRDIVSVLDFHAEDTIERGVAARPVDLLPDEEVRQELTDARPEHLLDLTLTADSGHLVAGAAEDALDERLADAALERSQTIHRLAISRLICARRRQEAGQQWIA